MIIIRIWFSFWWQVAACTRTATKILVSCLGKKQSALRWPVVKKTNATSTTTLPRLPSLQRSPLRLTALQREKSWERPLYWQLAFHCSFKYFKTFLWQVSLKDKLAAFDLLHGVLKNCMKYAQTLISWIFWELIVKPKRLKVHSYICTAVERWT